MQKKTPLYEKHLAWGGKIIDFGGWLLPVEYGGRGMALEHKAVREKAGLFDVSHMGEIMLEGSGALALVQKLLTNDAKKLELNQALYAAMCYPDGGVVDDLVVYKIAEDCYLLVVNGANIEKDYQWIMENKVDQVEVKNTSDLLAQLALQGPESLAILKKVTTYPVEEIQFYWCQPKVMIAGVVCLVSRTGYTGEDGFEIYCPAEQVGKVWDVLLEAGELEGLVPAGLGARDTLRLEAGLPLYGQELSSQISPLEAGLGKRFVSFEKGDFIGREALVTQQEKGIPRKLVGIEMVDKGIPRNSYPIFLGGEEIGLVTSGTQSPTLQKSLAMALVKAEHANPGTEILVAVRQKQLKAKIVARPFYQREVK